MKLKFNIFENLKLKKKTKACICQKMDQTTRPLLIPPQFSQYAEKHEIFELYQVRSKLFKPVFTKLIFRECFHN